MKKFLKTIFLILLSISLFSCSNSETNKMAVENSNIKTGSLNIVATNETYKKLFEKFENETGIKTNMLSMSSGEVLSKIRAEGGKPSADLWFGGGIDAFMSAKEDNLLEQVNFNGANNLDKNYKDEENFYFSKGLTVVGFLFNNDLMEEEKLDYPNTWDDLIDEQYKGQIVMSNPAISGTNYSAINALLQVKKDGWDFLTKLNDNVAYYGKRGSDPKNKVQAGEFPIGITYLDGTIDAILEENNLSIKYPEDGLPWVPDGVAVFKNSDNVESAKYFIEWLYNNDENLILLAEIDKKNTIKVIKPSIKGLELSFDTNILMKEDLTLFGSMRDEILDKFTVLMSDKAVE